jgi:putative DNA primase/helicase
MQLYEIESYLEKGWLLLPLRPFNKEPLTAHGVKDASADPAIVEGWLERWPSMNIGVACGVKSNLVAIDIDQPLGEDSWRQLCDGRPVPDTVENLTGGGGRQLLFQHPGGNIRNAVGLAGLPGLDVRAGGGYIVVPPSVHPNGKRYLWEASSDPASVSVADPPDWLVVELRNGSVPMRAEGAAPAVITEGNRNAHLTGVAGGFRRIGAEYETIKAALVAENAKCQPPLSDAELDTIARSVSRYDPTNALLTLRRTDSGNAERFVHLYGELLRYCADFGHWLVWDETRWRRDDQRIVLALGQAMLLQMYQHGQAIQDDKERGTFMAYVASVDRLGKMQAAIEWASANRKVAVRPEDLDRNTGLFNLRNGTYDLKAGEFREHRSEELITRLAGTQYDPAATCPRWTRFLEEIFPDDPYSRVFVQQAVGYSLTGDTREQCLFIFYGPGLNGKSTLLETIVDLLGSYAVRTPVETLMIRRGDVIPNDLARLKGARLVHSAETESGRRLAESLVKSLTGGDTIVARFLHAEFFEFRPTFKLFLATNHRPVIRGQDLAIWRRIRLVPFTVCFPPERQDKDLAAKLRQELPGILNWALKGYQDWQTNGLSLPPAVSEATESYRTAMDTLSDFLDECCVTEKAGQVAAQVLYEAYRKYCEKTGDRIASRKALGMQLEERGYQAVRRAGGQRVWLHISLRGIQGQIGSDVSDAL